MNTSKMIQTAGLVILLLSAVGCLADEEGGSLATGHSASTGCSDADGDGAPRCSDDPAVAVDCDDDNASVAPLRAEDCDGIDQDCDGEIDEFIGGCATATIAGPEVTTADDVPPATDEYPSSDSWPRDCSDGDGDGTPVCDTDPGFATDCDDTDQWIAPLRSEDCDGVDQDCDGEIDEYIGGCPTATIAGPEVGEGDVPGDEEGPTDEDWPADCVDRDGDGSPSCASATGFDTDCNDDDRWIGPLRSEDCDGIDQDCDGEIDEGIVGCESR
jgi:hypothetical protein